MGIAGKLGVAAALLAAVSAEYPTNDSLPIVDLGYELHQASNFNETGGFYNFSNIRFAAPPVGDLRFAPPKEPAENRSEVNDGSVGRICPQAGPAWSEAATVLLGQILLSGGRIPNDTEPFVPLEVNSSSIVPDRDGRESEDCLFLDVFVPEDILASAEQGYGAPVLVWIYGGGYITGNKYENPAGLLAASGNASDGNVIYVSMNYRLGAFGFSSGPSYNAEGGTSNLAFYDQRFALEWVQKYIHLFGGDPDRVTIFGESAGGGSIMHQITAYGGSKGPSPFQQAVPQSPGWIPVASNRQQEDTFSRLLNLTNTTSLEELRALPSEDLIRANYLQVLEAPYSTYAYGPVVDGDFVPLEPAQLLAQGRFDKDIRVMVGHNQNEGTYFTPPSIRADDDVDTQLRTAYPYIPQASIDHITDVLYPPVFDGSLGYTSQFGRASLMIAESIFTCNTFYLDKAYGNRTYSYLFAVPPAFHGLDVPYTYFTGGDVGTSPISVYNRTVAIALQEFITSFAIQGRPEAEGVRQFNMYGPDASVLELNVTGITEVTDSNANERCNWWQKVLYA